MIPWPQGWAIPYVQYDVNIPGLGIVLVLLDFEILELYQIFRLPGKSKPGALCKQILY